LACADFIIFDGLLRYFRQSTYKEFKEEIEKLGLEVNEEKTRIVNAKEGFDFLGMRFAYRRNPRGRMNCYKWPTPKAVTGIKNENTPGNREKGAVAIGRSNREGQSNYSRMGELFPIWELVQAI
jgi:hypothetical protein